MPTKSALLLGGDIGGITIPDPIGFFTYKGHSHIADPGLPTGGNSTQDQGLAHKLDGLAQPAIFQNVALAGAVYAYHNRGNGTNQDGGWAQGMTELPRDEQIWARGATTPTATTTAGVSTSVAVTARDFFLPGEWVVYGAGATMEEIQIASSYVPATGAGTLTFATAVVNSHLATSADPIYHSLRNFGYLPKAVVSLLGAGINDVAFFGPRNTIALDGLVFGTNVGAARGLDPFKHAIRFGIAWDRCSVVYRDTHPSCIYSASPAWTSTPSSSAASYPPIFCLSGTNVNGATGAICNYHSAAANGATVTLTTPPSFPGGTVDFFSLAGTSGQGALWNFTVDGSATPSGVLFNGASSGTGCHDNRNINPVSENDGAGQATGQIGGTVLRITGLTAGAHTIVATVGTINTTAFFLGWGIEPLMLPTVGLAFDPRVASYSLYTAAGFGYGPRAMAGARTATVAINSTAVTLGSAITAAVASTVSATATQPGDTITLDTGANQETRRIVTITDTTHVVVDSNFLIAHTGVACSIGLQDADMVGGGYANLADTQGKTSVPGLRGVYTAIAAEFDANVLSLDLDIPLNGGPGASSVNVKKFGPDGLHYNDDGSGDLAGWVYARISQSRLTVAQIVKTTVGNRRTFIPVYGDSGVTPAAGGGALATFLNSWSNYYPTNSAYPKTGFYKDMRTRAIWVQGSIIGGTDSTLWTMPVAYLPAPGWGMVLIPGWGSAGSGALYILASGAVGFFSGYPSATGFFVFGGSYIPQGL